MPQPKKPEKPPMVELGFATEPEQNRKLKVTLFSMLLAVAIEVARGYGVPIPEGLATLVVGSGGAYVIGEGVADHGKRRRV